MGGEKVDAGVVGPYEVVAIKDHVVAGDVVFERDRDGRIDTARLCRNQSWFDHNHVKKLSARTSLQS